MTEIVARHSKHSRGRKAKRTRTGCLNCRRKKRKCDESRPACMRCLRVGASCEWGVRFKFRSPNQLQISQPQWQPTEHVPPQFDITAELSISDFNSPLSTIQYSSPRVREIPQDTSLGDPLLNGILRDCDPVPALPAQSQSSPFGSNGQTSDNASSPNQYINSNTPLSQAECAAAHLLSLSHTSIHADAQSTPNMILETNLPDFEGLGTDLTDEGFEDGIFNPGSAYLDLHSTLRSHLIRESRTIGSTRCTTPCNGEDEALVASTNSSRDGPYVTGALDSVDEESPSILTEEQESLLWVNWLDEVAPWLDKFDHHKHFQHTLSPMAKTHSHVKYAILAVSARQMERRRLNGESVPSSLALYQQAIHSLLPKLATRSTHVIASCVVLCVLEMLSCSPKAWRRHLEGCATLLQAVGIHGLSGGLEQALFWCFARMDVCGGLISSTNTLIPISAWIPEVNLPAAIDLFRSSGSFDMHANQAVYLTAHVVDLLADKFSHSNASCFASAMPSTDDGFLKRWNELWGFVDEWYETRPEPMYPVYTAAGSGCFPTILFSNPAAISGNQLYHTAALLLLQHKPRAAHFGLVAKPRSILWHARRIVGISKSNSHHGCWTNSLQPLWIAGRLFSSPSEHNEILELLKRIEKESGWATKWRADDLVEWWGDLGFE